MDSRVRNLKKRARRGDGSWRVLIKNDAALQAAVIADLQKHLRFSDAYPESVA